MSEEDYSPLNNISFQGKTLTRWQDDLTVLMPRIPTTLTEITNTVARLNDQYQAAYNAFNELVVICSQIKGEYEQIKRRAIEDKRRELQENNVRVPGKDILENISIASSDEAERLKSELDLCEITRDFFENNKIKLEKCMNLATNISATTRESDKMHFRSGEPRI